MLELTSDDLYEGSLMDAMFELTDQRPNLSPALRWQNAPAQTKSFALTVYDPDAPTECGFWHWLVLNIPADTKTLARGASGTLSGNTIELDNDYGFAGFGGAHPPPGHGMHRYQFTLWALPDEVLPVHDNMTRAQVGFMLNAKALARKTLTATYVRHSS